MPTLEKILIVDDDRVVRRTLRDALRSLNFEPLEAETVATAREVFEEVEPAVVLLDMDLPDGSGLDVLSHIKEKRPGTVAVMIASNSDIPKLVTALQNGAHDFVRKPVRLDDLRLPLKNAVEKQRLRRQAVRARTEPAIRKAGHGTRPKRTRSGRPQFEVVPAAELEDINSLQELAGQLVITSEISVACEKILDVAIAILGADFGNVQIYDHELKELSIIAHRGFKKTFLDYFKVVTCEDTSACGLALKTGECVIVDDVEVDASFEQHRHIAASSGFRSVLSVPMIARDGEPLGILSIHFRNANSVTAGSVQRVRLLSDLAGQTLSRLNAEGDLRKSLKELEDIKSALDEAAIVATTDQRGRITYVNDRFCEISKYGREELLGQDHRIINSGYHTKKFIRNIWTTIANGKVWHGELRNRAKDGSIYWVDTTIVPFLDDTGKPYQYIAIRNDITNRKRGEEAISESENRFRMMTDEAPMLVWMSGPDKLCNYFNKVWLEFTGRTIEQEFGNGWAEGVHPDDFERCLEIYTTNFDEQKPFEMEYRLRRSDGEFRWIVDRGAPIYLPDGRFNGFIGSCMDITERKRAEEALHRPLKELADLKFAIDEAAIVATTDQRGRITYVNDKFCEISKYSREELLGQDHKIINSGYHPKEFIRNIWTTIANGQVWHGQLRNRAKDDSIYWVDTTIIPFCDENGKPFQYTAIRFDITQSKAAEERIREQAKLLEQSYDATFAWELDGGITHWNHNAETLYGYSQEEAMGKATHQLLNTQHPITFEEFQRTLVKEGRWEGELTHTAKDGRQIIVEARHVVSENRRGTKTVLETTRDITERKRTEERIQQQAALINKASDAIFVTDLNQRILFWNKAAERIYGWTAEEVIGKDLRDILYRGDDTAISAGLEILNEHGEWNSETRQNSRDGKSLMIERRWTLVRNDLGQPDYILIINSDITERKVAEEHLLRAQRMESIGTLAGGIAHDLNNVLSPILIAVDMLQLDDSTSEGTRWTTMIRESAERGSDLVKQVLTFARGLEGEHVSVQAKHVIKDLVGVLTETLPKNIQVKYNIDPELRRISADPTQIHQVLMNLCINARDAMPSGGTLKINAENLDIDENYAQMNPDARPGLYIVLVVEDTGIGISPDVITRIFDPFFTTKDVGKGTGLGLSTTNTIVKSHGGFLNVYSEPGKGSRFNIYLPAVDANPARVAPAAGSKYAQGKGELILVVDDEQNVREISKATLEKFNYRVLTATDGADAIGVFANQADKIDVVLTDMAMPFLDGPGMIRSIRRSSPDVKVIAMSGLMTAEQTADLESLKVGSFLTKPFTAEILLTTLKETLRSA